MADTDGVSSIPEHKWNAALHPEDPRVQTYILAERVDALTKEKEKLEVEYRELSKRVLKMERAFDRGAGILLMVPIIGGVFGFIASYWKVIFKPWMTPGQ